MTKKYIFTIEKIDGTKSEYKASNFEVLNQGKGVFYIESETLGNEKNKTLSYTSVWIPLDQIREVEANIVATMTKAEWLAFIKAR